MRRIVGVGVALLLLAACGGGSSGGSNPPSKPSPSPSNEFSLNGTLEAPKCGGGYNIAHAAVEIRDQKDTLIGKGTTSGDSTPGGPPCDVNWTVTGLPKDAKFYQIKIGSHGGPPYTYQELADQNFRIDLTLK